ncbi:MAG: NAD(P)H-dependent oxidoreductase [Candidatus Margulisbacteria bacterium]|nr:NAD(P)H-dependent oxidoreductase [Candidatus Margulisiibacteriota bacterium]
MNIPIILGTAREGRQSEKVANFVLEVIRKSGVETSIVDVRDYRLSASDNSGQSPQAKKLAAIINKADALIIVCPEYNHGYPGELKMMLDLLYDEYYDKPVGLCGVSLGPLGGARGLQALKLTLVSLSMQIIVETVYFANLRTLFDEQGKIKDASYEKKVSGLLIGLASRLE